jgi:hypothetical protein
VNAWDVPFPGVHSRSRRIALPARELLQAGIIASPGGRFRAAPSPGGSGIAEQTAARRLQDVGGDREPAGGTGEGQTSASGAGVERVSSVGPVVGTPTGITVSTRNESRLARAQRSS